RVHRAVVEKCEVSRNLFEGVWDGGRRGGRAEAVLREVQPRTAAPGVGQSDTGESVRVGSPSASEAACGLLRRRGENEMNRGRGRLSSGLRRCAPPPSASPTPPTSDKALAPPPRECPPRCRKTNYEPPLARPMNGVHLRHRL